MGRSSRLHLPSVETRAMTRSSRLHLPSLETPTLEASTMTRSSRLHLPSLETPTLEASTTTRSSRLHQSTLETSTMTRRSSLRKITNCRGPTMTICACRMQARTHTVLAFKTRSTMTNIRIRSLQGNLSTLTKVCLIRLERGQSCATRDISQLEARPGSDRLGEKATKKIHIQMQNRQRSRRCLAVREASHLSRSRAMKRNTPTRSFRDNRNLVKVSQTRRRAGLALPRGERRLAMMCPTVTQLGNHRCARKTTPKVTVVRMHLRPEKKMVTTRNSSQQENQCCHTWM